MWRRASRSFARPGAVGLIACSTACSGAVPVEVGRIFEEIGYELLVVAIVTGGGVAWRLMRKPRVFVHYWWEPVIDGARLRLSPLVMVGTTFDLLDPPPPPLDSKQDWLYDRLRGTPKEEVQRWLEKPLYRIGTRRSRVISVHVLRVVIHNSAGRKHLKSESFGTLSLTLPVPSADVHGWRRGEFGPSLRDWRRQSTTEDATATHIDISLARRLPPDTSVRDDLTVTSGGTISRERIPAIASSTTIAIRIRPWKPRSLAWKRRTGPPNRFERWLLHPLAFPLRLVQGYHPQHLS